MNQPISFVIPITIKSTANQWIKPSLWLIGKMSQARKIQKNEVKMYWKSLNPIVPLPCKITLTRIAPKGLDQDNLGYALKYVQDAIAEMIIPGLPPGRADGDKRLKWEYANERGRPKEYALKVTITPI